MYVLYRRYLLASPSVLYRLYMNYFPISRMTVIKLTLGLDQFAILKIPLPLFETKIVFYIIIFLNLIKQKFQNGCANKLNLS